MGVSRRRVRLLYASIRIRLHIVIRIRSVIRSVCQRDNFCGILSYGSSRSAPLLIGCFLRSYCDFWWNRCYQIFVIAVNYWLLIFTLPCSGVRIIMFIGTSGLVAIHVVWFVFLIWLGGVWIGATSLMKYLGLLGANFPYQIIVVR